MKKQIYTVVIAIFASLSFPKLYCQNITVTYSSDVIYSCTDIFTVNINLDYASGIPANFELQQSLPSGFSIVSNSTPPAVQVGNNLTWALPSGATTIQLAYTINFDCGSGTDNTFLTQTLVNSVVTPANITNAITGSAVTIPGNTFVVSVEKPVLDLRIQQGFANPTRALTGETLSRHYQICLATGRAEGIALNYTPEFEIQNTNIVLSNNPTFTNNVFLGSGVTQVQINSANYPTLFNAVNYFDDTHCLYVKEDFIVKNVCSEDVPIGSPDETTITAEVICNGNTGVIPPSACLISKPYDLNVDDDFTNADQSPLTITEQLIQNGMPAPNGVSVCGGVFSLVYTIHNPVRTSSQIAANANFKSLRNFSVHFDSSWFNTGWGIFINGSSTPLPLNAFSYIGNILKVDLIEVGKISGLFTAANGFANHEPYIGDASQNEMLENQDFTIAIGDLNFNVLNQHLSTCDADFSNSIFGHVPAPTIDYYTMCGAYVTRQANVGGFTNSSSTVVYGAPNPPDATNGTGVRLEFCWESINNQGSPWTFLDEEGDPLFNCPDPIFSFDVTIPSPLKLTSTPVFTFNGIPLVEFPSPTGNIHHLIFPVGVTGQGAVGCLETVVELNTGPGGCAFNSSGFVETSAEARVSCGNCTAVPYCFARATNEIFFHCTGNCATNIGITPYSPSNPIEILRVDDNINDNVGLPDYKRAYVCDEVRLKFRGYVTVPTTGGVSDVFFTVDYPALLGNNLNTDLILAAESGIVHVGSNNFPVVFNTPNFIAGINHWNITGHFPANLVNALNIGSTNTFDINVTLQVPSTLRFDNNVSHGVYDLQQIRVNAGFIDGTGLTEACDSYADHLLVITHDTRSNVDFIAPDAYGYGDVGVCEQRIALQTNVIGGLPVLPEMPNEHRPIVLWPDNNGTHISFDYPSSMMLTNVDYRRTTLPGNQLSPFFALNMSDPQQVNAAAGHADVFGLPQPPNGTIGWDALNRTELRENAMELVATFYKETCPDAANAEDVSVNIPVWIRGVNQCEAPADFFLNNPLNNNTRTTISPTATLTLSVNGHIGNSVLYVDNNPFTFDGVLTYTGQRAGVNDVWVYPIIAPTGQQPCTNIESITITDPQNPSNITVITPPSSGPYILLPALLIPTGATSVSENITIKVSQQNPCTGNCVLELETGFTCKPDKVTGVAPVPNQNIPYACGRTSNRITIKEHGSDFTLVKPNNPPSNLNVSLNSCQPVTFYAAYYVNPNEGAVYNPMLTFAVPIGLKVVSCVAWLGPVQTSVPVNIPPTAITLPPYPFTTLDIIQGFKNASNVFTQLLNTTGNGVDALGRNYRIWVKVVLTGDLSLCTFSSPSLQPHFDGGGQDFCLNPLPAQTLAMNVDVSEFCNNCTACASDPVILNGNATDALCATGQFDSNSPSNQMGSISLGATGGNSSTYTYSWTGPSSNLGHTNSIAGLNPGNYTVVVTSGFGCVATASFNVNAPSSIIDNASVTDADCGSNGQILFNTNGGTPGYFYSVAGIPISSPYTNLSAGTYPVTIADANSCLLNEEVNVHSTPGAPTLSITPQYLVCDGAVVLNATPGWDSYAWSAGYQLNHENSSISAQFNTVYTVSASMNSTVCSATASFTTPLTVPSGSLPLFMTSLPVIIGTDASSGTDMTTVFAPGVVNNNLVIYGKLNINDHYRFSMPHIWTGAGAEINIESCTTCKLDITPPPPATSPMVQINSIGDCMWHGITMDESSILRMRYSHIEDALYAVQLNNRVYFLCRRNIFNRNLIAIYAPPTPTGSAQSIMPVSGIAGNLFDCSATLSQAYSGMTTLYNNQPHINDVNLYRWSWAGILLNDVVQVKLGASNLAANTFMRIANGVITNNTNLYATKANFANIPEANHLLDYRNYPHAGNAMNNGKAITCNGSNLNHTLVIDKNVTMTKCHYGIDAHDGMNVLIRDGVAMDRVLNGILINRCPGNNIMLWNCHIGIDNSTDIAQMPTVSGSPFPFNAVRYVGMQINFSRSASNIGTIYGYQNTIDVDGADNNLGEGISVNDLAVNNGTDLTLRENIVRINQGVSGIKLNGVGDAILYLNRVHLNNPDYNRDGIQISSSSGLQVMQNTVSGTGAEDGPENNSFYPRGIFVQATNTAGTGTATNAFNCNKLFDLRTGLRVEGDCENTVFERNYMGDDLTGRDNFFGIHVTNMAKIGVQPDNSPAGLGQAVSNWNRWYGTYNHSNPITYQHPSGVTQTITGIAAWNANVLSGGGLNINIPNILLSTITIPNSTLAPLYYPPTQEPINSAWVNEALPSVVFINNDIGCSPTPPALPSGNGNNTALRLSTGDKEIINKIFNPGMYADVQKWVEEKRVYSKLDDAADSLFMYPEAGEFYDSLDNTEIGKYKDVEDNKRSSAKVDSAFTVNMPDYTQQKEQLMEHISSIDSLLNEGTGDSLTLTVQSDSLLQLLNDVQKIIDREEKRKSDGQKQKADEGNQKNEDIDPSKYYEDFKKATNRIYLNTIAKGIGEYDSTQTAALKYIAAQCFLAAGDAVFEARALISLVEDKSYDDYDICMERGFAMKTDEATPATPAKNTEPLKVTYHLFPNPASDEVKLLKIGGTYDNERVAVYDVLGKLIVEQKTNTDKNITTINTESLAMGNYFLRITKASEKVYQQTFSILK